MSVSGDSATVSSSGVTATTTVSTPAANDTVPGSVAMSVPLVTAPARL